RRPVPLPTTTSLAHIRRLDGVVNDPLNDHSRRGGQTLMRRLAVLLFLVACAHPGGPGTPAPAGGPYDVVIEGGRVLDGTGNPWYYGDVAIKGDRIARITPPGLLRQASARRRIDAHGLVVAPGIIDIQAQSGSELLRGDSRVISMVTQGVTTMIMGEGETPAPANDAVMAMYRLD